MRHTYNQEKSFVFMIIFLVPIIGVQYQSFISHYFLRHFSNVFVALCDNFLPLTANLMIAYNKKNSGENFNN